MATMDPAPASPLLRWPADASLWSPGLAAASLAWQQGVIALLDLQTAWCKHAERQAAGLLQPWLASTAAGASPFALLPGWDAWARVWVNALEHDAEAR